MTISFERAYMDTAGTHTVAIMQREGRMHVPLSMQVPPIDSHESLKKVSLQPNREGKKVFVRQAEERLAYIPLREKCSE